MPLFAHHIFRAAFVFYLLCFGSVLCEAATTNSNADCLQCHADETLTGKHDGKSVSRYFNEKKFKKSVHSQLECVTCHKDLDGKTLPHEVPLAPVDCGTCHTSAQTQFEDSLHGKALKKGDPLAPRCQSCHGYHDILALNDPNSKVSVSQIPFVCGSCRSEGPKRRPTQPAGSASVRRSAAPRPAPRRVRTAPRAAATATAYRTTRASRPCRHHRPRPPPCGRNGGGR